MGDCQPSHDRYLSAISFPPLVGVGDSIAKDDCCGGGGDGNSNSSDGPPPANTVWTDATTLGIRGRGWPISELSSPYVRLPTSAQARLCGANVNCSYPPPASQCRANLCAVWGLGQTATGMHVRFSTPSPVVYVRWRMDVENGDWLWAINGHSGIDWYVQDAATRGAWRFAISSGNNRGNINASMAKTVEAHGTGRNTTFTSTLGPMSSQALPVTAATATSKVGAAKQARMANKSSTISSSFARNITLYLPSRGLLHSVEIGVPPGQPPLVSLPPTMASSSTAVEDGDNNKPIVVYGTSILHGAATARAGMVWSSQLERLMNRSVVNLGFSGHGLMQPAVAQLLSEVQAAAYVLDCEFNMDKYTPSSSAGSQRNHTVVETLTYAFVKQLRAARPETPVLLIEGHDYTPGWAEINGMDKQAGTRNGYRAAYARIQSEGDTGVYYLNGSGKMGGPIATDIEAQAGPVAGVHVTDFAFWHFARYVGGALDRILSGSAKHEPQPLLPIEGAEYPVPARATEIVEAMDALTVEGLGWRGAPGPRYGRFPAAAEALLVDCGHDCGNIWPLSLDASGVRVLFSSNASHLDVHISRSLGGANGGAQLARQDDIMPWNGRFGIDVYRMDTLTQKWRWFSTSSGHSLQANETLELKNLRPPTSSSTDSHYAVYLPTHTNVSSVRIGHPIGTSLRAYSPSAGRGRIAVWGSSIAQGGVVANAGMTWPSVLGRLLTPARELLNFGFSGSCRMQPAVAEQILKLNPKPAVLLIDCLPNMDTPSVTAKAPPLLQQLRKGLGPGVPIVFMEGHTYSNAWIFPAVAEGQASKRSAQRAAVEAAQKSGDSDLYYLEGDGKLASLGEAQYEATAGVGVHPTNIAHLRIAEYVAKYLEKTFPHLFTL